MAVPANGRQLFARYAYPPNERGYCGPDDREAVLRYGAESSPAVELAQAFTGAWPYLGVIAGATGIDDPLDARVVEAYWVGNDLLDRVGATALGSAMDDRFERSLGRGPADTARARGAGGLPHHSYHVFCVYPWVGLLGNERMRDHALTVLDKCRIRWARVDQVRDGEVVLEGRPLAYDGRELALGEPTQEVAIRAVDGPDQLAGLSAGDVVSVHWDWVCDRLDARQVAALERHTLRHLAIANERLAGSGAPAASRAPEEPRTQG